MKDRTRLDIKTSAGKRFVILVKRDSDVEPGLKAEIKIVGYIKDTAVILRDSYPSQTANPKVPQDYLYKGSVPVETLQMKIESCFNNIELDREFGAEGIEWNPKTSTLRISISTDVKQGIEDKLRMTRIDSEGRPIEGWAKHAFS